MSHQSLGLVPWAGEQKVFWTFGEQVHFPCLVEAEFPLRGKGNEAGRTACAGGRMGFVALLGRRATSSPQADGRLTGEE